MAPPWLQIGDGRGSFTTSCINTNGSMTALTVVEKRQMTFLPPYPSKTVISFFHHYFVWPLNAIVASYSLDRGHSSSRLTPIGPCIQPCHSLRFTLEYKISNCHRSQTRTPILVRILFVPNVPHQQTPFFYISQNCR